MKKLTISLAVVLLVFGVLFLGAGWYFSGLILDGAEIKGDTRQTTQVTAVTETGDGQGSITYLAPEDEEDPATDTWTLSRHGLAYDGGYLQVDQDATVDGRSITRSYTQISGGPPAVGDIAILDWASFPDPESMDLESEDVTYESPLGPTPAIIVQPTADPTDTWAVVVHGRNASVREGLRITPLLAEQGLTTMLINYRDDRQEPNVPAEDGIGNFGLTEWADLQAAVDYATENGATNVLLVGYSMGGAIIPSYLENGNNTEVVIGTVLHSPAVSFNDTVVFGAEQMGLPTAVLGPLIWLAERMAEFRADVDFKATDYQDFAADWPVPALIMAASEDTLVPPESIETFANNVPDGEFILFDGADHTGEWNIDQEEYDSNVTTWLEATL